MIGSRSTSAAPEDAFWAQLAKDGAAIVEEVGHGRKHNA